MKRAWRYLRIAFSAACLVACGLVVALSVRSYRSIDIGGGKLVIPYEAISVRGRLKLTWLDHDYPYPANHRTISANDSAADVVESHVRHYSNDRGFGLYDRRSLMLPHWFAATFIGLLACIPWVPVRFSLRTLLIATALIAVALGIIVALSAHAGLPEAVRELRRTG
jgi:hypothetical protein